MSQSDFVSRGQALVAAGQYQEAVKVCRLGLLGRPTTVEGRVVLGHALLNLKRFDEVLAEMRVALDLDSTSIPAQVLRAEALLRKGDTAPAIEALHRINGIAPGDPRVMQLLGEAEHGSPSRASVTHPSVGFVGHGDTKHYPGHSSGVGDDDMSPEYTSPTSLASPTSRRSGQRSAATDPTALTPLPQRLPMAEKTGTVEVDPEVEGVELDDDVVAPPPVGKPAHVGGSRGAVMPSKLARSAKPEKGTMVGKRAGSSKPQSTMPLDIDEEMEELAETVGITGQLPDEIPPSAPRPPGASTRVRNAVAMPSGVIGAYEDSGPGAPNAPRGKGRTLPPPFTGGAKPEVPVAPPGSKTQPQMIPGESPRLKPPTLPPPLFSQDGPGRTLDGLGGRAKPASMPPAFSAPPPPTPLPPSPRAPIAAALPTVAAAQPPPAFVQQQAPYPQAPSAAPNQRTMAVELPPADGWNQQGHGMPRSVAAAHEPTQPAELDPHILALMSGNGGAPPGHMPDIGHMQSMPEPPPQLPSHLLAMEHVSMPMPAPMPSMRTGVRKPRSKLQMVLWALVGVLVIGGGVFAGFKIRAVRLEKKIASTRQRAVDVAKADTFAGWTAARDSLSSIVGASSTSANRAALARMRAMMAYEVADGVPEAKAAVEQLSGQGGLDGRIAVAFEALRRGDVKAAKSATDEAVAGSDAEPMAQYVAGEAALLGGNAKVAIAAMKLAADKDARPLFGVGLARAYAAAYNWDEAIAAIDRVLAGVPDHPLAVIARANMLATSGRIFSGSALGNEVKQQLERLIVAGKTGTDPNIAPVQVAFASLALARVELARGDLVNAKKAVRGATDTNVDDPRFAEETIDTLYSLGELALARSAAELALKQYPASMRVRVEYANVLVAQGRANDAIDMLGKDAAALALPDALAARGNALLAVGDTDGAASDFDAALKMVPTHEPAIVGRAWLELATGDVDSATKRIAARMGPKGASTAVQIAYAATLRRSADPAQRDQAKPLLERAVGAPGGPELSRAHLELARIYRDAGDFAAARAAYDRASKSGSLEARLEAALVLIEYSKPDAGRELLEKLYTEAGDRPSAPVVIETARARILMGAHADAANLLALADKMSSVERWKLDRERGRLSLRKSDFTGAATALARALDGCGSDAETFLIAADAATADKTLADKVGKLAAERLKGRPEAQIVAGKLAIAAEKPADAETAYKAAKQALRAEKASNRRVAQADFGLAYLEYSKPNLPAAQPMLELVMQEDPTLVDAYMIAAEIAKEKKNNKKAYELAQTAARYNPDYTYAWLVVGQLASQLKDKRTLADAISRLTQIAPQSDELKELQSLK